MKKKLSKSFIPMLLIIFAFTNKQSEAQGTWTPLTNSPPIYNLGVMLLLTDGTVMVKGDTCQCDSIGSTYWNKLTPDIHGSYVNGTWSSIDSMHDSRVYFTSQVLMDGRVFVAGGEYGTGGSSAETYDPLTDTWTMAPPPGHRVSDANSEILPDGRVLHALVSSYMGIKATIIYDPATNTYTPGPTCNGIHNESSWVKLPDSSILFIDNYTDNSERYIPSLNQWVVDSHVPVSLYDPYGFEMGAGFLLPDGRAFFLGSTGHTVYYTPTGNINPGTWTAGPDIPNGQGTPDAGASMMPNGKILSAVSPVPMSADHFPPPTSFYEFDYLSNSFTRVTAPGGGDTLSEPCYFSVFLNLPDGTILYGHQSSTQYYVYSPGGTQLAAGKPTISNVMPNPCDTFLLTGTLFNGISEGSAYGDDWQMATNYPIVRIISGANVYYARTFNWNSTGVQRGSSPDTAFFTLPAGLQHGTYSLIVSANGISSDSVQFIYSACGVGIAESSPSTEDKIVAYPNPAVEKATVSFSTDRGGNYLIRMLDVFGRRVLEKAGEAVAGNNSLSINIANIDKGVYMIILQKGDDVLTTKILIE